MNWLDSTPRTSSVRTAWLAWFTWLVIGGALLFEDWKIGGASFNLILTAPFWLLWLAWPVWRIAQRLRGRGLIGPVADWSGQCLRFDGEPLRVIVDGDSIYVVAEDLFELFELPPAARVPAGSLHRLEGFAGGLLTWAQAQECLSAQGNDRAARLLHMLDAEVVQPLRQQGAGHAAREEKPQ
ncbi:MAG: hypothetical protein RR240_02905 [Burkholderiaceae bacterium]